MLQSRLSRQSRRSPSKGVLVQGLTTEELAGRPWCRACEAGPSPDRVARGRHVLPGHCSRFESASIRVEHEPGGTEERPLTGPAVARCLLHHAMVHSARSYTRRNAAFSALRLPSALAREVAYSQRSCSHASERDPEATVVILGRFSPPLNTRALRTRLFERPNGSS